MGGERYDIIIVGSGPGGAGMAWRLAQTGKRILLIERGDYLKREPQNWSSEHFVDGHYNEKRSWDARDGSIFQPYMLSYVGGNSKFYGSVLFRLREQDFGEIRYPDGVSPAWPVGYDEFEPYYQRAEDLYHVHGLRGEDRRSRAHPGHIHTRRYRMSRASLNSRTASRAKVCILFIFRPACS